MLQDAMQVVAVNHTIRAWDLINKATASMMYSTNTMLLPENCVPCAEARLISHLLTVIASLAVNAFDLACAEHSCWHPSAD